MVKLGKLGKPNFRNAKGWPFALVCGLVLGILVLLDNGVVNSNSITAACRVEVTADTLNARATPDASAATIKTLHRGDILGANTTVQNSYRKLLDGTWALDDFLRPLPGSKCAAL